MNRTKRRPDKTVSKKSQAATNSAELFPPDDRGLKIGEAAKVIGVEAYVLRFWETQFAVLKPKHARSKHRFYQPRDIETLKLIKRLLHQEGFTIAGANKYIRENGLDPSRIASEGTRRPAASEQPAGTARPIQGDVRRTLVEMRRDLETIQKLLDD
jgi:DNA-binding transcriptional MerR regulator